MKNHTINEAMFPFLIEKNGIYVIVQEREGDVFVICPFSSCKTGFVDILDAGLSAEGRPGVIQYLKVDDFLTCVQISEGHNMDALTASMLVNRALDELHSRKVTFDEDTAGANGIDITINSVPCKLYGEILISQGEMFLYVD